MSCDVTTVGWLEEEAVRRGAGGQVRAKQLHVGGAFHCARMATAKEALAEALAAVPISMPRVPVISNVTGAPYESAEQIRALLPEQMVTGVQWQGTMERLLALQPGRYVETGPGRQLRAMLRKMDAAAFQACECATV